jgi:surface antigen
MARGLPRPDRRPIRPVLVAAAAAIGLAGCTVGGRGDGDVYTAMTDQDVDLAVQTLQKALEERPNGVPAAWRNDASGNAGTIEPVATWVTTGGYPCRDYVERLRVDGTEARFRNTACRDDEGRWVWLG